MTIRGPIPNHILRLMPKEERKPLGKAGATMEESEAKAEAQSERKLQENIAALLRQRNIWYFRSRMDKRTTCGLGTPDFLFAYCKIPVAIECKSKTGLLTDEQISAQLIMSLNGWRHYVVRSESKLLDILNAIERGDAA